MSLGISPRDVERLTLFDLEDLQSYWRTCPPPHVLIAAYLGALKEEPTPVTRESLRALAAAFGMPVKENARHG